MEFRTLVRNNLGIKADNKQIDDFFSSMDADGGGSLDFNELKIALKTLQDATIEAEAEGERWRARAEQLKTKAEAIKEVAAATLASEEADARLYVLKNQTAVDAVLGTMILKRNLKHVEKASRGVLSHLREHFFFADSDFDVLQELMPSLDEDDGEL